ncbi:MAG: 23S rRNA (adenine(2503)-C(2))-methyltransferase RlmN [Planctomycetes bacterium]|nr:23S rRNA (adenine(2503)-C(2))-methyltransferase RlmN [Planctomycetota bacterium]
MEPESVAPQPAPVSLLALDAAQAAARFAELGLKPFHAKIARKEVLERGITDYAQMTALPAAARARLSEALPILSGVELDRCVAHDRTTKLLLSFPGGPRPATVETVHIPPRELASGRGATLCVSSQVGCPVACPFCASGRAGLVRNLEAHEIVEQYVRGRAIGMLARSVVMGIGEPLLNFANLSAALDVVHDEMGLGSRKVTVSTVGFPDRLRRIAPHKPRFQLAISLHTPDQAQRDVLVPAMAGVPIEEVLAAGDDWFEQTGREITYEYVLLANENDTFGHAERLAQRLARRRCTVNLIPFNPVDDSGYGRPSEFAVQRFHATLVERGLIATVRWSRGVESDAACGQLRIRQQA